MNGIWAPGHADRVIRARLALGRKTTAMAGIIDSQSVPITESDGPCGFDADKRVKERKRHIVTDTEGLLLAVVIHPANVQDVHGAVPLLQALHQHFPELWLNLGDGVM